MSAEMPRRHFLKVLLGLGGAAAVSTVVGGAWLKREDGTGQVKPNPTDTPKPPATAEPSAIASATREPSPTTAPATATVTSAPTSTEVPPSPSATTTGTATREATATTAPTTSTPEPESEKKPENFLPEYSVFYGPMTQEGGTGKGSIIIAKIPGYPNHLYVFDVANRSGQGYLYKIKETNGNNLEAIPEWVVRGEYVTPTAAQIERAKNQPQTKVKITSEGNNETLSGRYERPNDAPWVFNKIKFYGTGRDVIIEAAKKLWATEVVNFPTGWQKVPEATILQVGFRGIKLP